MPLQIWSDDLVLEIDEMLTILPLTPQWDTLWADGREMFE